MRVRGFAGPAALVALLCATDVLRAQTVHEIQLHGNAETDRYVFRPAKVSAKAGDLLRFVVVTGAPHNVVFDRSNLGPGARAALNAAMPRRFADLTGPLLTAPGARYEITLPALPPGRYRFFCQPHQAYDMAGELTIPAR